MIFFTDITTDASNYCLLNIKRYNDPRKHKKKVILVDPGVYELKKSREYSKIDELHKLVPVLEANEYISIDYPCDMNPKYSKEFIEKSIDNNFKYANYNHYICTVQFKFKNYKDFCYRFDELQPLWTLRKKVVGIGNFCRIFTPTKFTDKSIDYIIKNKEGIKKLHFYGLAIKLIEKYVPKLNYVGIKVSVDSTKWTKARSMKLKRAFGLNCMKNTRTRFFSEYMKQLNKKRKTLF